METNNNIAVIDLGSNSFHLLIISLENDKLIVLFRSRKPTRLSEKIDINGNIPLEYIESSVNVISEFIRNAKYFDAEILTVGTAFLRIAKNANVFVDTIREKTGIEIQILRGEDEGYFIYRGVKQSVNFCEENYLIVDIGGGSTEFIVANDSGIKSINSIDIGCVSSAKQFFKSCLSFQDQQNVFNSFVVDKLNNILTKINKFQIKKIIGTSGTIRALISFHHQNNPIYHPNESFDSVETMDLINVIDMILDCKDIEEIKNLPFMDVSRADILPASSIILKNILEKIPVDEVLVSEYSIKEGIVFDHLNKI